jgi:hypothetical protein
VNNLARDVIDFTELYILDVQPLTRWQRWVMEQLFAEDTE